MQTLSAVAEVVVELPLETPLDYHIPPALQCRCQVGQRVLVPVGNRQHLGYIVALRSTSEVDNLRDIQQILDEAPLLTQELLQLTRWIADYYMCPWGLVLKAAVPEGFRVRSTTLYTLTAEARQQPHSWPGGRSGTMLACLAEHGPQQQHELEDRLAGRPLGTLLRRLTSEGFIQTSQQILPPKARQRLASHVRLQLSAAEVCALQQRLQARAPTQAAILALLHDQDTWELPALRLQVPGAAAAVKRLAQQGVVRITHEETFRRVVPSAATQPESPPILNQAQQHALLQIEAKLSAPDGIPILLHGVTGSGKTEVYMRGIATALEQGKTALILVPEISLTDQLVERFVARFSSRVAVLHSGLSAGERFDEWRRLAYGDARIAIGARSAIFAPAPNLGLIIVDEEHDTSY
jgi:primosomal protein N' (replication factor Y)